MIRIQSVCKSFEKSDALKDLTLSIKDGEVFGLVGTNGSGKTTLMTMICGILKADYGVIMIDDEDVYENKRLKQDIFYVADDAYFQMGYNCEEMKNFYRSVYPKFDEEKFYKLLDGFGLDKKLKVSNMSKGMKKQLSIILGVSAGTRYLLLDETFDGLDPVKRQAVKSLLANEICEREVTPIIASHNLRELEDFCENIALLHEGGVLVSGDMDDLKETLHKVQCAFKEEKTPEVFEQLAIQQCKKQGSLYMLTIRGEKEEILSILEEGNPIFCEVVPLSLEEIFISETGVAGYEVPNQYN